MVSMVRAWWGNGGGMVGAWWTAIQRRRVLTLVLFLTNVVDVTYLAHLAACGASVVRMTYSKTPAAF